VRHKLSKQQIKKSPMRARMLRLGIAGIIALIGLALFGTLVSLAAPPQRAGIDFDISYHGDETDRLFIRRFISIPFGIDLSLDLSEDGQQIFVTGPGRCQEGGEKFKLRVTVTQDTPSTRAKGDLEDDCAGGADFSWETVAEAQGPKTFQDGDAEVCAMVVVFVPNDGKVTQQWCKDVTLETN